MSSHSKIGRIDNTQANVLASWPSSEPGTAWNETKSWWKTIPQTPFHFTEIVQEDR